MIAAYFYSNSYTARKSTKYYRLGPKGHTKGTDSCPRHSGPRNKRQGRRCWEGARARPAAALGRSRSPDDHTGLHRIGSGNFRNFSRSMTASLILPGGYASKVAGLGLAENAHSGLSGWWGRRVPTRKRETAATKSYRSTAYLPQSPTRRSVSGMAYGPMGQKLCTKYGPWMTRGELWGGGSKEESHDSSGTG